MGGANKEYTWNPEDPSDSKEDDENDPSVKPGHRLLIKSAVLMPSAKVDEVTIVQIESEGYKKQKVEVPICAMKGGKDYQTYVDLLIPCPAKLTLLEVIAWISTDTGILALVTMTRKMKLLLMKKLRRPKPWMRGVKRRRKRRLKKQVPIRKRLPRRVVLRKGRLLATSRPRVERRKSRKVLQSSLILLKHICN